MFCLLNIHRFGTQRIRLAIEFLTQEIQSPTDRIVFCQKFFRSFKMSVQTIQLFFDISPHNQKQRFLIESVFRNAGIFNHIFNLPANFFFDFFRRFFTDFPNCRNIFPDLRQNHL